jgi:hypothetical protein
MQAMRTAAAATAATATATVRVVQPDDVLWSLHLEHHYTKVHDSASASACTALAAILLKCGLHM